MIQDGDFGSIGVTRAEVLPLNWAACELGFLRIGLLVGNKPSPFLLKLSEQKRVEGLAEVALEIQKLKQTRC